MTDSGRERSLSAREVSAILVLVIGLTILLWCGWFSAGAFFREMQMPGQQNSWSGIRKFAAIATMVSQGLFAGALAVIWATDQLIGSDHYAK